jgi:FtsH-binding integral membrane protein
MVGLEHIHAQGDGQDYTGTARDVACYVCFTPHWHAARPLLGTYRQVHNAQLGYNSLTFPYGNFPAPRFTEDTIATAAAQPLKLSTSLPGRRFDHIFFSTMALLLLATVFMGFANTYYLAGVFRAPLPAPIIHIHGAAFSCWILLLVAQTSLVAAGRVDIHRRLGIAGFLLASAMVVLGVLAATNALVRDRGPVGLEPKFFYIIPMTDMLVFATLVLFAFRARKNSAAHKRLIMVATIALMTAALVRWPFGFIAGKFPLAVILSYGFLLVMIAYDLWSTHKVHRATIWASTFLIVVQQIRIPIGKTAAWSAFATWAQSIAR